MYPYGREFEPPRDQLGSRVVGLRLAPSPGRQRLTAGIFIPKDADEPVAVLEAALRRGDRGATDRCTSAA